MRIAALYVYAGGIYDDDDGIDLWDESRDARLYAGPWPVVAHPPCSRWSTLATMVELVHGHRRGEDGGCFASALASVRRWGGVLEHPAYSDAWRAFGLPTPSRSGGWQRGFCGGWSAHVEQGRYGHPAKKATWLYAFGVELPTLRWGPDRRTDKAICGMGHPSSGPRVHISGQAASATPIEFRDALIAIARTAAPSGAQPVGVGLERRRPLMPARRSGIPYHR